jgi:hypothetical protein
MQGGSVFADFDIDNSDSIFLRRISFDGHGCCEAVGSIAKMNSSDSRLLLDAIDSGELSSVQIERALRGYFRENTDTIWGDALQDHDLL